MKFRWPDDPNRITADFLKRLDGSYPPGTFVGEKKWDDFRRPAYKEGGQWTFHAKRNEFASRLPPPDLVRELETLDLSDGTALDMGWVGPRDVFKVLKGRNFFVAWDLIFWQGEWQGAVPFSQRHANLSTILGMAKAKAGNAAERILVATPVSGHLFKLFEEQKQDPLSEGIVVRKADSGLVGGWSGPTKNSAWFKAKYRDIKEPTAF